MAAPTFVAEYETAWNNSTTPKTVSVTTAVGDVLVLGGIIEGNGTALNTPTGGTGLTWTLRQSISLASYTSTYVWTATATTAETFTMSVARTSVNDWFGWNCLRFSDSDGIGDHQKTNAASAAPSRTITTTQDNSAICCFNGDWNATDGASRTWRTINSSVGTERTYFRDSSRYATYANTWLDVGAIGTFTTGLTAPATQNYSIISVEVKGTAGAAPKSLLIPRRAMRGLTR